MAWVVVLFTTGVWAVKDEACESAHKTSSTITSTHTSEPVPFERSLKKINVNLLSDATHITTEWNSYVTSFNEACVFYNKLAHEKDVCLKDVERNYLALETYCWDLEKFFNDSVIKSVSVDFLKNHAILSTLAKDYEEIKCKLAVANVQKAWVPMQNIITNLSQSIESCALQESHGRLLELNAILRVTADSLTSKLLDFNEQVNESVTQANTHAQNSQMILNPQGENPETKLLKEALTLARKKAQEYEKQLDNFKNNPKPLFNAFMKTEKQVDTGSVGPNAPAGLGQTPGNEAPSQVTGFGGSTPAASPFGAQPAFGAAFAQPAAPAARGAFSFGGWCAQ